MARILTIYKTGEWTYNKTVEFSPDGFEGEKLSKWAMIEALKNLECSNTVDELNEHLDMSGLNISEDTRVSDNTTVEQLDEILGSYESEGENSCCLFIINMDTNDTIFHYGY